jgi:GTPase SAR1 family protein
MVLAAIVGGSKDGGEVQLWLLAMAAPAERPDTPEQDLWSSILDSVSKSRSTPSKQILLLGEPRTGKTTLATALLQKKIDKDDAKDEFALGFDWSDVRDDADEGKRCYMLREISITCFR